MIVLLVVNSVEYVIIDWITKQEECLIVFEKKNSIIYLKKYFIEGLLAEVWVTACLVSRMLLILKDWISDFIAANEESFFILTLLMYR